ASENQQRSPFLRLPPELRNRIYQFVLQAESILIYAHRISTFSTSIVMHSCCSFTSPRQIQHWREDDQLTFLPVVCRQVYAEMHALLYTLNNFIFVDGTAMRSWMSCRTLRQRQLIRSLKLPRAATNYYQHPPNTQLVRKFPNLKVIYMDMW
ncbi:hypothetical protein C7974DRAFT_285444, partial [Boeremia exigua]|uniref:uncharacterized protein n=1 Tax=Boeremia exigua TaxID=749465 RepID=UPI001E8EB081